MAGLWSSWSLNDKEIILSYTIITKKADANISHIHKRMPLIIDSYHINDWLNNDSIIQLNSNSELITGNYPLLQLDPVVSPETNANYGPSITVPIWDQDSVAQLEVRYTLDGTDPANGAGTIYEVTLPPNSGDFIYTLSTGDFTNSTTLKVFASSDVYLNSDIVSYTRQQLSAPAVTITQNGNSLDISMSVSMPAGESRTPSIYYTLDGSAPDETDYNYTSPISLQGSTATVKAKAFLVGYIDSNITTETYP